MPTALRRTLTWDQGAETSGHRVSSMAADKGVYFCELVSPWWLGTNENREGT